MQMGTFIKAHGKSEKEKVEEPNMIKKIINIIMVNGEMNSRQVMASFNIQKSIFMREIS